MKIKAKHYRNLVITQQVIERFAKTIAKMFRWMDESRREGLLSLEDQCEVEENEFLAAHLQDILDGTDPSILKVKMQAYTRADGLSGIDLVLRAMEMNGLLFLQEGVNPHVMCEALMAYVPGEARRRVATKLPTIIDPGDLPPAARIYSTANESTSPEVTRTIDLYRTLGRTDRFYLLRATDRQVITRVLYQAPKAFQRFVLRSMPIRKHWLVSYELANLMESFATETLGAAHAIFREEILRYKCR